MMYVRRFINNGKENIRNPTIPREDEIIVVKEKVLQCYCT